MSVNQRFLSKDKHSVKEHIAQWFYLLWQDIKYSPWYLAPLIVFFDFCELLLWPLAIIGRIRIETPEFFSKLFPRKPFDFDKIMQDIFYTLKDNGEEFWAESIQEAVYISQSSWEVAGTTRRRLQYLLRDPVSRKLKLRKKIKIAINVFTGMMSG
jgi:hypothetical protein